MEVVADVAPELERPTARPTRASEDAARNRASLLATRPAPRLRAAYSRPNSPGPERLRLGAVHPSWRPRRTTTGRRRRRPVSRGRRAPWARPGAGRRASAAAARARPRPTCRGTARCRPDAARAAGTSSARRRADPLGVQPELLEDGAREVEPRRTAPTPSRARCRTAPPRRRAGRCRRRGPRSTSAGPTWSSTTVSGLALCREAPHGGREVRPAGAVEPRRAHDPGPGALRPHRPLPGRLGPAVGRARRDRRVGGVRLGRVAREDVVGRQLHHGAPRPPPPRGRGSPPRRR